jgi:hypothetical protein
MNIKLFARCALASLALAIFLTLGVETGWAREGFYVGVGAAQQSAGGDLDGTHSYADPSGSPVILAGKLGSDQAGGAAVIGYGLSRFFALEYLMANSQHKASSPLTTVTSNASFSTQVLGARFTLPFGEKWEAFLRGGYGIYEADYSTYSFDQVTGQNNRVVFDGTGTAVGAGIELFFGRLGVEFGYTTHTFSFDQAKPSGSQKLTLDPKQSGTAATTDVIFSIHF